MGDLNSLLNDKSENTATIARVSGIGMSGEFKVAVNGKVRRVSSAISDVIKVGGTVILNKTPHGKYYIVGIASGLGNSKEVKEIIRNG